MKISVIIPAFNRQPVIGMALRSLLRQRDAADLDIIVIDDGSTDGTADVVKDFIQQAPCIRLIQQENKGISGARNTGLRHLPDDADLVTFLDSDDVSMPDHFANAVPLFDANPELELTYARFTMASRIDSDTLTPSEDARTHTYRGVHLASGVFRKRSIDEVGKFSEELVQSEDFDFLLRFFERERKYVLPDHVSFIYRRHPGNVTQNRREVHNQFLRVLLTHAQKRRRDSTLNRIPAFFEYGEMFEGDEVA